MSIHHQFVKFRIQQEKIPQEPQSEGLWQQYPHGITQALLEFFLRNELAQVALQVVVLEREDA